MFYHFLYPLHESFQLFNVFKYITFRTFAAMLTALGLFFIFGRSLIDYFTELKVGQFIREEGPQSHQVKKGTPTMGGVLIVGTAFASTLIWGNLLNGYVWLCLGVLVAYGAIGFIDDYRKLTRKKNEGLKGRYKLLFQILFALTAGVILLGFLD